MKLPSSVPVRALGRDVLRHWSRERRTIRQGFLALAIATGVGMAAGVVLGRMEGVLDEHRGLLVLVPAAIGMRGAIFGALGARLGTGILTGLYETTLRRGSFTAQNVEASVLLTFFSSALAAIVARAASGAFGLPTISLWDLMLVSMVGGLLSSAFILCGVLVLARQAQLRDWDMDAIGSPIITATGDIVTLPALVLATLFLDYEPFASLMGVAFLGLAAAALYRGVRLSPDITRSVVRQSLVVLAYASVVDVMAGTVLETRLEQFVTSPGLLVLIPPFIATCGSLGGILSARLGSDLHLGLLTPRAVPERLAGLEASITVLFSVAAFTGVGVIAHTASHIARLRSPGLVSMVVIALAAGLLATAVLSAVAYAAASVTFRLGLDPDNYGIPIVTATMDFLGVLCLVAAIAVVGHT
jgi:mgtE-like transporter